MDDRRKKEKNILPKSKRDDIGEITVYACVKRDSYLFLSYATGKWTQETCDNMIKKAEERIGRDKKVEFFSDGNDDYLYVLPRHFEHVNYSQLVKIREKGRVVGKIKRGMIGEPCLENTETTNIENFNSILRERIGRLVRKTKCYSKILRMLDCALEVFQFYWNMIKPIRGKTPAMKEGLTEKAWTWNDLLTFHYAL